MSSTFPLIPPSSPSSLVSPFPIDFFPFLLPCFLSFPSFTHPLISSSHLCAIFTSSFFTLSFPHHLHPLFPLISCSLGSFSLPYLTSFLHSLFYSSPCFLLTSLCHLHFPLSFPHLLHPSFPPSPGLFPFLLSFLPFFFFSSPCLLLTPPPPVFFPHLLHPLFSCFPLFLIPWLFPFPTLFPFSLPSLFYSHLLSFSVPPSLPAFFPPVFLMGAPVFPLFAL